jgi:hypothetical protein
VCHEVSGDVGGDGIENSLELLSSHLPLERFYLTSKNIVSVNSVLLGDRAVRKRATSKVADEVNEFRPADESLDFAG